jgi:hypothetical protein
LVSEPHPVSIQGELYEKLKDRLKESGATSVDELASRIIRDWLTRQTQGASAQARGRLSKTDEKVVEERLKSLGYI